MSKFGAIKTIVDGIKFDSKKEAYYYRQLLLQKSAKNKSERIESIELQPKFDYLIEYSANDKTYKRKAFYKADFLVIYADFRVEIIDVKGFKTVTYKQKKKIIETLYNIKIIEK